MKRGNGFLMSKSFEYNIDRCGGCTVRFQCRILLKRRWKELEEQKQFYSKDE